MLVVNLTYFSISKLSDIFTTTTINIFQIHIVQCDIEIFIISLLLYAIHYFHKLIAFLSENMSTISTSIQPVSNQPHIYYTKLIPDKPAEFLPPSLHPNQCFRFARTLEMAFSSVHMILYTHRYALNALLCSSLPPRLKQTNRQCKIQTSSVLFGSAIKHSCL